MKICPECKSEKQVIEFAWSNKSKGRRQPYCNDCRRVRAKQTYGRHKQTTIVRSRKNSKNKAELFKAMKATLECVICGENEPIALDFHHKNPKKKDFELGMGFHQRGWKTILKEMSKCVCVCATHHRKIHGGLIDCKPLPTVDIEKVKQFLCPRGPNG